MIKLGKIFRLITIQNVILRYVFNRDVLPKRARAWRALSYLNPWSYLKHGGDRGESICAGLITLGPLFVKFGQILSTRHDLFPENVIIALTKLQDRVPPFPSKQAIAIIEDTYKKSINTLFAKFDPKPLASASVAQVHTATLHDGSEVIVKVLRPNIQKTIKKDIALLYVIARLVRRFWRHGKRLRPVELVAEFEQTLSEEQDLMREAANASQLRRNFEDSDIMYVPEIYWQYVTSNVMVMERIYGIPINNMKTLKSKQVNLKRLAENGVTIFFTQVFRDGFFHADMHPGNLFVNADNPEYPLYIGVDFGIMGTLNPEDLQYIALNLLAFFKRDYRRVAVLHVESGWVSSDTRVDQFESAIRTVCEPIFEKPLKDISFGQLLLRLFQTAERFHMEVQPQLMLLQKTLLNIESLGRNIYPDLDLWATAQPFMEKWMKQHYGAKALTKELFRDFPGTTEKLIKTPEAIYDVLSEMRQQFLDKRSAHKIENIEGTRTIPSHKKYIVLGGGIALLVASIIQMIIHREPIPTYDWVMFAIGGFLLFLGWLK